MKLLFDQNLSFKLCSRLDDLFPGSSQVRELGLSEADDKQIWEFAEASGFILISQDADFAEMAALSGLRRKLFGCGVGISRLLRSNTSCAVKLISSLHLALIARRLA